MKLRAAQLLGEAEPAFVGPVHEIGKQICKTFLAAALRAGNVSLQGRVG
jgi:hypothetical protein